MRFFALIFAIVFLALGILPFVMPTFPLFGYFATNVPLAVFNCFLGLWALIALCSRRAGLRFYFQGAGILLGLMAILGFLYEQTDIFGIFASNMPNTWLHVIGAVLALVLGFGSSN